jgi:putative ABC transport system ATP-binding protein
MNDREIVAFSSVTFSYSPSQVLFKDLSYTFKCGTFYLVRGPSGVGKSTLLRLINRLEDPGSGEILFKGRPLQSYHPPVLRRSILYIQQTPTVVHGSVRDNLLLPFTFKSNKDLVNPGDERLRDYLDELLLRGVNLDDNALTLSVGQLQRLCLIRGLLLLPEILLLDEPTSALDDESRKVVETMAERQCLESNRAVIMVSHREYRPRAAQPVNLEIKNSRVEERIWDLKSST